MYDSVKMINLQDLTGLSGQPPRPKQLLLLGLGNGFCVLAGIFIEDPLQRWTFKRTTIGHSLRFSSEGGWRSRADEPIEFETLEAPGRS